MPAPDKVKIGAYLYRCIFDRALTLGASALGRSSGNVMEIAVDASMPRQNQESVLLHEIIEQLNYRYELKLDHTQITILESTLYQVMRDNPEAMRWMLGEDDTS